VAATTTTHDCIILLAGGIHNNAARRITYTTAHLATHLLEELARLLASDQLEFVTTAASDGGRVSGRAVEGDKSFRGSRHSVLYYLEEKFLGRLGDERKLKIFI
jgi:hypothetical protein